MAIVMIKYESSTEAVASDGTALKLKLKDKLLHIHVDRLKLKYD